MSDEQQPDHMRPIPDGGLKDAMPAWLTRPPAWRAMPSAAERHERTLPEPDTSTIDPRTLLDVADLPQWLQAIAARGEIKLPEPDASVDHAVEQVLAVKNRELEPIDVLAEPETTEVEDEAIAEVPVVVAAEPAATPESSRSSLLMGSLIAAGVIIVALIVVILFLL